MEELQQKHQASTLEVNSLSPQLLQQSQLQSCLNRSFRYAEEVKDVDQCHSVANREGSQLFGVRAAVAVDADLMKTDDGGLTNIEVKVDVNGPDTGLVKRKRGRPPKGQARTPPPVGKQKEEEDVCFICFDGGSLVLCDRRACPKAYHPACVKRDEAFFRSKAKWNCGWHICSICQKASHYMCYTCTYSLCKGCTKDADYLCVRGTFGFCGTCMRTIMLIENNAGGTMEKCEVDFDDKSSWEYLFKVYWIYLKRKLSLTLDELTGAQSPWKGDFLMGPNGESSRVLNHSRAKRFSIPGNSGLYIETSDCKRRKTSDKSNHMNEEVSKSMVVSGIDKKTWASDKLLEFVGHMKNGDTSVLSQLDVQALLLEYIKKNNLRDPLQQCQIICDSRLVNLFGKARLGHIEMLKLLESHFLIREDTSAENSANRRILDAVAGKGESNGLPENKLIIGSDKRHKSRKKIVLQAPENDLNAFAAINSHNIKLIYLCRNQMEILIKDADKFHQKVVGSIVRVKIPNGDQKPDMYRLVQVVGTSKIEKHYNVGTRTTDLMLEVINLNKKEVISIGGISNHEFSEDECRRFRQSIKCGLSKCLTVGEIQEKAMTFQAMRIDNLLEAEILRLNHLRDRASEKGHKKELRECVEKLQLLNSKEERQHRLHQIPEVHSDSKMDPSYESDDEDNGNVGVQEKKDDNLRSKGYGVNRIVTGSISPRSRSHVLNDARSRVNNTSATNCNQLGRKYIVENMINPTAQGNGDSNDAMTMMSNLSSLLASDILPSPNLKRKKQSVDDFKSDNIWHYQDPYGKTQGPFSLFQLRKWHAAGHFPADLRVWRTDEKKDDSVLLVDALDGKCHENVAPRQFMSLGVTLSSEESDHCKTEGINNLDNSTDQMLKSSPQHNGSDESVKSNEWNCHLSGHSKHADFVKAKEGQSEGTQTSLDLAKWGVLSHGKTQDGQPLPSTAFTRILSESTSECKTDGYRIDINSDANDGNQNFLKASVSQSDQVLPKQSDSEGHSGQSSENWRHPPLSCFSSCLDSTTTFVSMSKKAEQNQVISTSNIPNSIAVNSTSDCWDSKSTFPSATKAKALQPNEEIDFFELPSPTPKPSYVMRSQAGENKQSPSSSIPVHDAGHCWSTASSLVGGPVPHPEAAVDWTQYSTMPPKPSIEEWDSSFVSASSSRPTKIMADNAATPSSINCEQTHSPPHRPACTDSNWNAIIGEANEFNSLVDESVSDLLAEVEAMESLGGLDSPTSIMKCGEKLTVGSKNDCLSSAEGFSPMPDQSKSDALSSTTDAKLPTRSNVSEAPHSGYQADMLHYQRLSVPLPTACTQSGEATKKNDALGRPWEAGAGAPVSIQPPTTAWEATDSTWRLGSDSTNTSCGTSQVSVNMCWSALKEGNPNMNWGVTQGTVHGNGSLSSCTTTGNPVVWGTQTRYVTDRQPSPRDGDFHGRDYNLYRGRTVGNRVPFFGVANGGSHGHNHRHAPKGQRVCKYYERGYCKKGASCSYWHP